MSARPSTPFRELLAAVFAILVGAALVLVAVALLFLLGKWGYHGYLWLWRHA